MEFETACCIGKITKSFSINLYFLLKSINFDHRVVTAQIRNSSRSNDNIYTPSVFCYDKHKKKFDIQFSLKRHETV